MTRRAETGKGTRRQGTALVWIATLMICSAVIRMGFQAGPALAREMADARQEQETDIGRSSVATNEALNSLLQELLRRERAVEQREMEIQDRMKSLEIADRAIESRLSALAAAEDSLKATMAMADVAAENDLQRLTEVYENMKPKEAAALFEAMDPTFAAGFLARMKPDTAAAVMAGLSPQAAYTVSVVLAGRNASAPRE